MERDPSDPHGWRQLAAELATTPDVVRRILAAHTPDAGGRCRACTTGGTGQPGARWPCTVRQLAAEAARVHDASVHDARKRAAR